jgi:hypothetical protein
MSFQGHHCTAHMACIPYPVIQYDISIMEKALIDRGSNGGICGDNMLVPEGTENCVDVFGLPGHKVNQLRIVTTPWARVISLPNSTKWQSLENGRVFLLVFTTVRMSMIGLVPYLKESKKF